MSINAKTKNKKQDHPILLPFRLNGQWHYPREKTISLSSKQASFLLLSGKVAKPGTKLPIEITTLTVSKEVK